MKIDILKILPVLVLIGLMSCSSDDGPSEPTPQELTRQMLSGNWSVNAAGAIMLDGTDVSLNYAGFQFSFNSSTYSTVNAGDLLNASGSWNFVNDSDRLIQLDGSITVTINSLNNTGLDIAFEVPDVSGTANNANGTSGNYEIRLIR